MGVGNGAPQAVPDGTGLVIELALVDAMTGLPADGVPVRAWLTGGAGVRARESAPGAPAADRAVPGVGGGRYRLLVPAPAWPAHEVTAVRVVALPGVAGQRTLRARVRPSVR